MPIKLSDLTKQVKTIPVKADDLEFHITYKTNFYTPKVEALVIGLTEDDAPLAANVKILADALVSWDITDDDGNEIKPTEEVLSQLGVGFLSAVFQAIAEASSPKKVNSES